jgi:hypothetical protein
MGACRLHGGGNHADGLQGRLQTLNYNQNMVSIFLCIYQTSMFLRSTYMTLNNRICYSQSKHCIST